MYHISRAHTTDLLANTSQYGKCVHTEYLFESLRFDYDLRMPLLPAFLLTLGSPLDRRMQSSTLEYMVVLTTACVYMVVHTHAR